jgi:hypothetical protein
MRRLVALGFLLAACSSGELVSSGGRADGAVPGPDQKKPCEREAGAPQPTGKSVRV